ncbi:hypothetical protein N7457_000490 [Penicillium paradoxum]|uniref:uncharacterized protein n=1 Tax=Penicillium paradoxum TaxID=176176 RepID=UPI002547380C|nr:uncharacterized protein N7457_000490 [Penicillium paradoxum]KAJ5793891.1 hypothetical protein N7457_000490 [Penicillium paradoxum]
MALIRPAHSAPLSMYAPDWSERPCFILRGAMVAGVGLPVRSPPAPDSPLRPTPVQSSSLTLLGHSISFITADSIMILRFAPAKRTTFQEFPSGQVAVSILP